MCLRAKEGNEAGGGYWRGLVPCTRGLVLFGFITIVSVTANTHCMTDGLTLACLTP